jgi:chitin synthase
LQKAQQFEYAWDNIFNKNFQSIFRYIPVLPSAWSAYRWDALCEDNLLEKEYLNTVKDPDYVYKSIKEANKMLTEDRLLSLAIFTKRNRCYFLKYCPDAKAETDLIETVPELLNQRKRIINGSWYAIEHIIYYNNQIRYSRHTNISKMMFSSVVMMSKINLILLYLTPTFYYVALKIVMFEYLVNVSLVANPATSLAGFFLFLFIALMTSLIFISLQFKSIDKDMSFFFRVLSHFMGIFMLFTFGVLMKLLATEIFSTPVGYFMSQTLIQIFVLVIFGSIAFVVLLNPPSWRHLFFGFLHYLYYLPTYAHITTVYAFCRIDDLSWGATGAHVTPPAAQRKEFKDFKVEFVATWLIVNTLFAYIIIVVTSSPTNEGGFLTFMLFLMAALTSFKALWSCIYALKYRLFDQKTHYEKTKELKQYYKKSKEEIEKYYEKIKFGGDASVVMEDDSVQQPQGNEVENSVLLAVGRANPFSAFGQNKKSIVATG